MTAAIYNITVEQGSTFTRNFYFGQGAQVKITSYADAGGGVTTVAYTGKDPANDDRIVIINSKYYTGTWTVAAVDTNANTFTIATAFEATETGTYWMDAWPLTGHTYAGSIKENYGDSASIEDFTTALTDAAGGHLTVSLTSAETTALTSGKYYYDIEQTNTATTAVERILKGVCNVSPEITT